MSSDIIEKAEKNGTRLPKGTQTYSRWKAYLQEKYRSFSGHDR